MKKIAFILLTSLFSFAAVSQNKSDKALRKDIDQLLKSYEHYQRFSGNVLISRGKKVIYQNNFGYANIETAKKHSSKSIFNIASISKPITAVGIMKLVEEGKMQLENPISKFIPNFAPAHANKITIQHLLNHSSGLEANIARMDDSGNGLVMPTKEAISFEQLCEKFKNSGLKFTPGQGYEYNNLGYLLLAHIIEKVTNQSYGDYIDQVVFQVANMKSAAFGKSKYPTHTAQAYLGLGQEQFKLYQDELHPSWLMGAGGIYASSQDLINFMQALEEGKLLQPTSVAKLYQLSQSMQVNEMSYGLGWVLDQRNGTEWRSHDGSYFGYSSMLGVLPERYIKIVVLSNATASHIDEEFEGKQSFTKEITEKIIELIYGKTVELLPIPQQELALPKLSKAYQLDAKHTFTISQENNQYSLSSPDWSVFTYAFSKDVSTNTKACKLAKEFALAMEQQQLDGLVAMADDKMKGFFGTAEGLGQLKGMWGYFLSQAGAFKSSNIYRIAGEDAMNIHIRFHFEKKDVGMVLSFNKQNQVQGLFLDDAVKTSHIQKVKLIQTAPNEFFINGYQYGGMQDLRIKVDGSKIILMDKHQQFEAKAKANF